MTSNVSARVRAKFPLDEAMLEVWAGRLPCPRCRHDCSIIAGFRLRIGELVSDFNLAELGALDLHRAAWFILGPLARAHGIDWQESRSRGQVLANACPKCRAAVGAELDLGAGAYRVRLGSAMQPLDSWRQALFEMQDGKYGRGRRGGEAERRVP